METTLGYLVDVPGLAEEIALCAPALQAPAYKSKRLVECMRKFEALANVQLGAQRGDRYLIKCKVLDAQGGIVSDDHEAWLREQLAADDGRANSTYERLKGGGYLLSKCRITSLYFVQDRGSIDESNFIQVEVDLEDDWSDRELFTDWPFQPPRDLKDLLDMPGYELPEVKRHRVRAPSYRLRKVIDVKAFVQEATALEMKRRQEFRQQRYTMQVDGQPGRVVSADQAFPGWDAHPVKWGRLFADWAASSAGRSGARLCDHWAMQVSDYTSPKGERSMSLIPLWASTLKLAKVEGMKGSAYELFGKLEKLDRRVKVPFAWYFYMLHGNRVDDAAGHRVIKAAEAGKVVLSEHDYRVLKSWESNPYGF